MEEEIATGPSPAPDAGYYARRAAKARAFADRASQPGIRALHLQMAARYDGMAAASAPADAGRDDIQSAIDCIGEAIALLDARGRAVEAAYLSTALEMLIVAPAE